MIPTRLTRTTALVIVGVLAAAAIIWQLTQSSSRSVTAYFTSASALYVGNPVEVLGVPVGSVDSVEPEPGRVKVVMSIDGDLTLPSDVTALQVSPSLISGRNIALAPAYEEGPQLADGAVIPENRTQVPLDVNDLFESANELSDALGPEGANRDGSLSRALKVAAKNLDGNGDAIAEMIRELSGATATLSGSREDLTGTIDELQTFVETLTDNDGGVRTLNQRLSTVSEFLADDRTELREALRLLSVSLDDVARFVKENRALLRTNVDRLSSVSDVLVRQRAALADVLDEAPTGLGNLYNAYDAGGGTLDVRLDVNELSLGPVALVCELINRSSPAGLLPAPLVQTCARAAGAENQAQLPTIAELVSLLQGNRGES